MIIMSSITVTPSTSGQYGGKSQTLTFYPIIGFQYTTFHKGIDPKVRVIQCNMVNEEDFWRLKVILSRHVIKKLFYPKNGLDGAIMGTSQTKNSKCIGSNMVNHAQDWSWVKKFIDWPNKLIPMFVRFHFWTFFPMVRTNIKNTFFLQMSIHVFMFEGLIMKIHTYKLQGNAHATVDWKLCLSVRLAGILMVNFLSSHCSKHENLFNVNHC